MNDDNDTTNINDINDNNDVELLAAVAVEGASYRFLVAAQPLTDSWKFRICSPTGR
jgi:hypothetical protein